MFMKRLATLFVLLLMVVITQFSIFGYTISYCHNYAFDVKLYWWVKNTTRTSGLRISGYFYEGDSQCFARLEGRWLYA